MVKDKPRMIEHWEVKQSIFLGGHEILFAEDESNKEDPYFVGDCSYDNPFGVAEYLNCIGTADYLEAVSEYTQRIQTQIQLVRQERADRGIGDGPLSIEHCLPGGLGENIAGKLVVIKPGVMHRDRRTADYQTFSRMAATDAARRQSAVPSSGKTSTPRNVPAGNDKTYSALQTPPSCRNGQRTG
jgi:hypothetical protein